MARKRTPAHLGWHKPDNCSIARLHPRQKRVPRERGVAARIPERKADTSAGRKRRSIDSTKASNRMRATHESPAFGAALHRGPPRDIGEEHPGQSKCGHDYEGSVPYFFWTVPRAATRPLRIRRTPDACHNPPRRVLRSSLFSTAAILANDIALQPRGFLRSA